MNTPQSYKDAYEATNSMDRKDLGRGFLLFAVAVIAFFIISIIASGCKKEAMPEVIKTNTATSHLTTSSGSNQSASQSQLQMYDTVGARFRLTFDGNECHLRRQGCFPQGSYWYTTADSLNGDFLIHQNGQENFSIIALGATLVFQVSNLTDTTAAITFLSTGQQSAIVSSATQLANGSYVIPVNQNRQFIAWQTLPWSVAVVVPPTNPY